MTSKHKSDEIDIFEQLDAALEEREGSDRRRENVGYAQGRDRRNGDRRKQNESSQSSS